MENNLFEDAWIRSIQYCILLNIPVLLAWILITSKI